MEEALTAWEVVNRYGYPALTRIIREYGEEGDAAKIARQIVEARKKGPITNAKDLADIVAKAKKGRGKIHPATKTFQAIRIEVNRELANLADGLRDATDIVRSSGRIGVITFHSLEDRMVKTFFKDNPLLSAGDEKTDQARQGGDQDESEGQERKAEDSREAMITKAAGRSAYIRVEHRRYKESRVSPPVRYCSSCLLHCPGLALFLPGKHLRRGQRPIHGRAQKGKRDC